MLLLPVPATTTAAGTMGQWDIGKMVARIIYKTKKNLLVEL
jgi:hypothetical protein